MLDAERQQLIQRARHADEELRRLAVERATLLGSEAALPLLVERLADPSWRVRKAAVERLAALPQRANAVSALLSGDRGWRESRPAQRSARGAGAPVGAARLPALVEALSSPDVDVRKQVVDVLGAIGDPRAERPLAGMLRDTDPNVRAAAADALRRVRRQRSRGPVAGPRGGRRRAPACASPRCARWCGSKRRSPSRRSSAALADSLLAPTGYALLGQSDAPGALDAALKGLLSRRAGARDAAAGATIALALRADGAAAQQLTARVREFAAAHAEIAHEAVARSRRATRSASWPRCSSPVCCATPAAARSLARCGADMAVASAAHATLSALGASLPPALAQAWPRLSAAERAFACSALESCGAGASAESMLRTTLLDPSSEVRAAAARALARCASANSFGEMLGRLAQEDPPTPRGKPPRTRRTR